MKLKYLSLTKLKKTDNAMEILQRMYNYCIQNGEDDKMMK